MSFVDWLRAHFPRTYYTGGIHHGRTKTGHELLDAIKRDEPGLKVFVVDPREHPVVKSVEQPKQEPEQDDPWLHLMEEGNNGTTS